MFTIFYTITDSFGTWEGMTATDDLFSVMEDLVWMDLKITKVDLTNAGRW